MATRDYLKNLESLHKFDVCESLTNHFQLGETFTTGDAAQIAQRDIPALARLNFETVREYMAYHLSWYEDIERIGNKWRW